MLFTEPRQDYYCLLYVALSLSVTRYLPLQLQPVLAGRALRCC